MRIGELARQAGVDVQTVRYYEREGLLEAPARTGSGYRAYGPQHLERLNFVRHCRSLDMPLAEIKRLIDLSRDTPFRASRSTSWSAPTSNGCKQKEKLWRSWRHSWRR